MPESLGSLIDRLTVTNLKLWEAVEEQKGIRGPEDCADAVRMWELNERLLSLNAKRNALVKEIDQCLPGYSKKKS